MAKFTYSKGESKEKPLSVHIKDGEISWSRGDKVVKKFPAKAIDAFIDAGTGYVYVIADTTDDKIDNPECFELRSDKIWNKIDKFSYDDAIRHHEPFTEAFDQAALKPVEEYTPLPDPVNRYEKVIEEFVTKKPVETKKPASKKKRRGRAVK